MLLLLLYEFQKYTYKHFWWVLSFEDYINISLSLSLRRQLCQYLMKCPH